MLLHLANLILLRFQYVRVEDLDIFLPTMMLTASTYGRGIGNVQSIIGTGALCEFFCNTKNRCVGQTVSFTDLSTFSPTA